MEAILRFTPSLLEASWITVQITALGILLATFMGFLAGLACLVEFWPVRAVARAYVEIFRGTSALVQLFWMYFVLPHFGISLSPYDVGWLALGLNVGAYGAEVVRGAILAVPKGQYEAATALNMPKWTAMRRIIVPQAIPSTIPPWGNLFIELMKATSLVSLITLTDLTFRAKQLNDQTFMTLEIFGIALLIYLAIALVITGVMRAIERHTGRGLARGGVR